MSFQHGCRWATTCARCAYNQLHDRSLPSMMAASPILSRNCSSSRVSVVILPAPSPALPMANTLPRLIQISVAFYTASSLAWSIPRPDSMTHRYSPLQNRYYRLVRLTTGTRHSWTLAPLYAAPIIHNVRVAQYKRTAKLSQSWASTVCSLQATFYHNYAK